MEEAKAYKKTNLNFLNVALMFVGAIMGAGFASGREIWQFFGVFGKQGRVGILLIAVMFVVLGMMTADSRNQRYGAHYRAGRQSQN
mgnify:CR=1 FL=1